ncbi:type VII secretion protein EsaA [Macrococcoides canis]|uniref:type VII secretion protein EsaA n=1 Tax=Macrococcoides canis TaxID=1855823 RepID=UPI0020B638AE|nr:type VII secretion protein EsaA [Macrococcus canis]UTH01888.1 type VII secretion protein EsaA [Macrococcus canis]
MNKKIAFLITLVTIALISFAAYFVWHNNQTTVQPNKQTTDKKDKKYDDINVAIVNEDIPVKQGDNTLKFGEDFAADVVKNNPNAVVVNRAIAENGLKDNLYNVMILIPDDFSKNATSFSTNSPKKLNIKFKYNTENNKQLALLLEKFTNETASAYNNKLVKIYFGSVIQNMMNAQKHVDKNYDNHVALQNTFNQQLLVPIAEFGTDFIDYGDYSLQSNAIISKWNETMNQNYNDFRSTLLGVNTTPIDEKVNSVIAKNQEIYDEQSNILSRVIESNNESNQQMIEAVQSLVRSQPERSESVVFNNNFENELNRFYDNLDNGKQPLLSVDETVKQNYEQKVKEMLSSKDTEYKNKIDSIISNEKIKQDELKLQIEEGIVNAINHLPTHNIENVEQSELPNNVKQSLIRLIGQSNDFQEAHPEYNYTYGEIDLSGSDNDNKEEPSSIPISLSKKLAEMNDGQLTIQLDPNFTYEGQVMLNGVALSPIESGTIRLGNVPANTMLTVEGNMIPKKDNVERGNYKFIIDGQLTTTSTEEMPTNETPTEETPTNETPTSEEVTTEMPTSEPSTSERVTTEPSTTETPKVEPTSEVPTTENVVNQMSMENLDSGQIKVVQVVKKNDNITPTKEVKDNKYYYYEISEQVLLKTASGNMNAQVIADFTGTDTLFNIYNSITPRVNADNPETENVNMFVQLLTDEIYGPLNAQIEAFNQENEVYNQSIETLKAEQQKFVEDYKTSIELQNDSQSKMSDMSQSISEALSEQSEEPIDVDITETNDTTDVTLSLSEDISNLMNDSIQLLDQTEQSSSISSEIERQLSSLKDDSSQIEAKGKELSDKANRLNNTMEENLKSEEKFKENFTQAFENAERNGQPNEDLKEFVGMPLEDDTLGNVEQAVPAEKKYDGPIYIVLFIYIFSLLIGYFIASYEQTNHIESLFKDKYSVMTPIKRNMMITFITLGLGIILGILASVIGSNKIGITEGQIKFAMLILLTAIVFTLFNTFMLRQLKSIGMLISLIILSFYLLTLEGLSQFKAGLLNAKLSPLNYVDRMFFNFLSGEYSIQLYIFGLIVALVLFVVLNLIRKQFKNQVMI